MKKIIIILCVMIFSFTTHIMANNEIVLMTEFGLGNIVSLYGGYKLDVPRIGGLYVGAGAGYFFYDDKDNDTSINVIEPSLLIMKEIKMVMFRIRTGMDFISEKRFGFKDRVIVISPDIMVQIKGIYAGISAPIIIGNAGNAVAFSIGVGYRYIFEF